MMNHNDDPPARGTYPPHPRTMGWLGTTALAIGGSNQMVFLIGALLAGQGSIPGQGTAAVPLLAAGLVLSWMAAPGWTELVLMWPGRVGGIAATCGEAFRPYAPVLGNLTGIAYWWGWVPTCGVCALLSAGAIHEWFLPAVPTPAIACAIIASFAAVNLCGVRWVMRLTIPIGFASATLAFLSAVVPVWSGHVNWRQATSFHLTTPFPGWFGAVTSTMAGLYLVGFAAPAFEAAACHVGETRDPARNVPRAMFASAVVATLYFAVLPAVWLGCVGSDAMAGNLANTLGPTFAPVFGGAARAAAAAFMVFNMFHGTIAPLTGVCRTLSQLAEDGLLPECFAARLRRTDAPWVAITVTAVLAMGGVLIGDPVWFIAAANLTYLIGIALPNVAVWLLRRDMPDHPRPYRAPRGTIVAGLVSAAVWGVSTVLGFEQFGLPVVVFGLVLAYSGSVLYAWRKWSDHRRGGNRGVPHSLHVKLTGAMMVVLALDAAGYLYATHTASDDGPRVLAVLSDIFVAVALLTIVVGLILPGMIAHSAVEVNAAARRLATGTLADFSAAMEALASGDLDAAHARVDIVPVVVHTKDELGQMAVSFNHMQDQVKRAAVGLDGAREGLRRARGQLEEANATLEHRVTERTTELRQAQTRLVDAARHAGMAEVAAGVLHNVGNVLNSVNVSANVIGGRLRDSRCAGLARVAALLVEHEADLAAFVTADARGRQLPAYLSKLADAIAAERRDLAEELAGLTRNVDHIKRIVAAQQDYASATPVTESVVLADLVEDAVRINQAALDDRGVRVERAYDAAVPPVVVDRHKVLQVLVNLLSNARWAVGAGGRGERVIRLSVDRGGPSGAVRVAVTDTGVGIAAADLPRLFAHGFTRRPGGHGFGLHASAVAAATLGGSLRCHSDGPDTGATFTLELPAPTAVVPIPVAPTAVAA